jgi:molybdate transport system substrate-binding protein
MDSGQMPAARTPGGRRRVDGAVLARFSVERAHSSTLPPVAESARNHFPGLVTKVTKDKVMAQVEIQAGPYRVVSLMSSEAADELKLAPGMLAVASVKSTNVVIEELEIAVATGNPKHISGVTDLAKPGVSVVLEAVGVPAGDYTRQILAAQHLTVTPKSLETDVKSAIAKVTSGEADATVVYVTDVTAAGSKVIGVPVADNLQPAVTYPIAVVKATKNQAAAQAFVNSAVSGDVQKALESAGFLPPQ